MTIYQKMGKRCFDLAVSLPLLILFAPIMAIIAAGIKIDSPGSIIFRSKRMGYAGITFNLYKFRTMAVDVEQEEIGFTPGSRSRVTLVGNILRKTKLDELPQLINVIKGDMSLVGPRPEVLKYLALYAEQFKLVHQVRPGVTDYASIEYRDEEEILAKAVDSEQYYINKILPHKLELNKKYIGYITFFGDIGIILKTISRVISPKSVA